MDGIWHKVFDFKAKKSKKNNGPLCGVAVDA